MQGAAPLDAEVSHDVPPANVQVSPEVWSAVIVCMKSGWSVQSQHESFEQSSAGGSSINRRPPSMAASEVRAPRYPAALTCVPICMSENCPETQALKPVPSVGSV